MTHGQRQPDSGGSQRDRVLPWVSHRIRGKAMEGPRNPISQARAFSFGTQNVAVADLQDLFSYGPPRSRGLYSSEVSRMVCAAHIPGDFLG